MRRLSFLVPGLLSLVLGCATPPVEDNSSQNALILNPFLMSSLLNTQAQQAPEAAVSDSVRTSQAMPEPPRRADRLIVAGVAVKSTEYDFPVREHPVVDQWAHYFLGRGKSQFEKYLARSEYMVPEILPILRAKGLPEDLIYLTLVESGFSFHARSQAAAMGPWQFIASTGRHYGLIINWWMDERRNLKRSTEAAATYLSDLYTRFGSWELAAAAYNAGEQRVQRAIEQSGTRDFWKLIRGRYLPAETRNYVPKIIAAAVLAKNRKQFGLRVSQVRVAQDEVWREPSFEIDVPGPLDLLKVARAAGVGYAEIKHLNPHLLRWCSDPESRKVRLRLPVQARRKFLDTYLHPSYPRDVAFREYHVRQGDTLGRIARRFGLRIEPIQELNGLDQHRELVAGNRILLPLPSDRDFGESRSGLSPVTYKGREAARSDSYVEGI